MKLITYSLYKSSRHSVDSVDYYFKGLLLNLARSKQLYPDYRVRVYLHDVVQNYKEILEENGAEVIIKSHNVDNQIPTLWRFEPLIDGDFEIVLFRDADSLLYRRERDLVKVFEESNYNFHIIRDHPAHVKKILAGMWGAKTTNELIKNVIQDCYNLGGGYGFEEMYFEENLYDIIKSDALEHDSNKTPEVFNIYPNEGSIGFPIPM